MVFFSNLFGGKETLSAADMARDIKEGLNIYEMAEPPGTAEYKMHIRINNISLQGGNKSALKSELKEAIANPEFKKTIGINLYEYLVKYHGCNAFAVTDNKSLVLACADRLISDLNDHLEDKFPE